MSETPRVDLKQALPPDARILIVKLSSMGDVVHVTPCVRALRKAFPAGDVTFAVEERWSAVVRHNPHVNRLVTTTSSTTDLSVPYLWRVGRLLSKAGPFDAAIDLQGTRRSGAWVYLSRARIKAGRGRRRPGWDLAILPDLSEHAILVAARICGSLGVPVDSLDPEIALDQHDEASLDERLRAVGAPPSGFIVANPFSRWPAKDWPATQAASVCARLAHETNRTVIIAGGADDRARSAWLKPDSASARASNGIFSLVGDLTLGEALCLYRRADVMISCDSGPMHAAAALGTPVVALFGPTFPERTGPWGTGHRVLQASRPLSHDAYRRGDEGRHMEALDADAIVEAATGQLLRRATASPNNSSQR